MLPSNSENKSVNSVNKVVVYVLEDLLHMHNDVKSYSTVTQGNKFTQGNCQIWNFNITCSFLFLTQKTHTKNIIIELLYIKTIYFLQNVSGI